MRRIYYHHVEREDCQPNGMWRIVAGVEERQRFVLEAGVLMAYPERFLESMMRVLVEWPKSCQVNMTTPSLNQHAWLGHAGCFLATGSPEDCTRLGWHTLSEAQQVIANQMADQVIAEWNATQLLASGRLFDA